MPRLLFCCPVDEARVQPCKIAKPDEIRERRKNVHKARALGKREEKKLFKKRWAWVLWGEGGRKGRGGGGGGVASSHYSLLRGNK